MCRVHFLVKTAVRGTHGNWTWPLASTNKALVRSVQRLSQRTSIHLRGNLWCKHVYGHSNHAWNDRADELARLGKRDGSALPGRRRGVYLLGVYTMHV